MSRTSDAAARQRGVQPLVRIERDRVGSLDAGEERAQVVGEHRRASVGGVDVQPDALVADRRRRSRRGRRPRRSRRFPRSRPPRSGCTPASRSLAIAARSSSTRMRKSSSTATWRTLAAPTPSMSAAADPRRRASRSTGRSPSGGPAATPSARMSQPALASRATLSAMRFAIAPPEVSAPPEPPGMPNISLREPARERHLDLGGRRARGATRRRSCSRPTRAGRRPHPARCPPPRRRRRSADGREAEYSKVMRRRYSTSSRLRHRVVGDVDDDPGSHLLGAAIVDDGGSIAASRAPPRRCPATSSTNARARAGSQSRSVTGSRALGHHACSAASLKHSAAIHSTHAVAERPRRGPRPGSRAPGWPRTSDRARRREAGSRSRADRAGHGRRRAGQEHVEGLEPRQPDRRPLRRHGRVVQARARLGSLLEGRPRPMPRRSCGPRARSCRRART